MSLAQYWLCQQRPAVLITSGYTCDFQLAMSNITITTVTTTTTTTTTATTTTTTTAATTTTTTTTTTRFHFPKRDAIHSYNRKKLRPHQRCAPLHIRCVSLCSMQIKHAKHEQVEILPEGTEHGLLQMCGFIGSVCNIQVSTNSVC